MVPKGAVKGKAVLYRGKWRRPDGRAPRPVYCIQDGDDWLVRWSDRTESWFAGDEVRDIKDIPTEQPVLEEPSPVVGEPKPSPPRPAEEPPPSPAAVAEQAPPSPPRPAEEPPPSPPRPADEPPPVGDKPSGLHLPEDLVALDGGRLVAKVALFRNELLVGPSSTFASLCEPVLHEPNVAIDPRAVGLRLLRPVLPGEGLRLSR